MMSTEQSGGSIFGSYGMRDPSMNVPVTSQGAITSPYLNFDPSYLGPASEPQFIFPEGSSHRRGRFELAFQQIGGSVLTGGAIGGLNGIYSGLKETSTKQLTGAVYRTQMLNFITKQGASTAQALGIVALMYSGIGTIIAYGRGAEDELNTLSSATLTGLLYKSSAGWKKSLRGGGIGLGIAAVYCLWTSRDRLKQMAGMD